MLISLEAAADLLNTTVRNLYDYPKKYKKYLTIGKSFDTKFDIDEYYKDEEKKENLNNYLINTVNFAEYVIDRIGEDRFYKNIPTLKRQDVKDGIKNSKFSKTISDLVNEIFILFIKDYESLGNIKEIKNYVPVEEREPLSSEFIMAEYWTKQKTTLEISKFLNVPEQWVRMEINRLGLGKKQNGIKLKSGKKGTFLTKQEKQKRENQPHRKEIVQICPKTFQIVKEYSSQGAVERFGFNRENVRRAIKTAGLHKGYLWAFKGFDKPIVKVAQRRGNLETKLRISSYKKPTKEELYNLYIVKKLSAKECAKILKCEPNTVAILAMNYGLKKKPKKITEQELKRLYLCEDLTATEIAKKTGYTKSSISTFLSRYKIKKTSLRSTS